jgi:hypothetical protein
VHTDHVSLKFLLDGHPFLVHTDQWVSKLLSFDFRVEYKLGAANTVADALSHRDANEHASVHAISAPSF